MIIYIIYIYYIYNIYYIYYILYIYIYYIYILLYIYVSTYLIHWLHGDFPSSSSKNLSDFENNPRPWTLRMKAFHHHPGLKRPRCPMALSKEFPTKCWIYTIHIYIYVYIHTHTFTGCENGDRYQNSWDFMGYKYDQEFLIAYQIGYKTTYSFLLKKTLLGLYQTNTIWKIRTVGVWPSQKYGKAISCFLSSHMRHLKL